MIASQGKDRVVLYRDGDVAVLLINNPPVNAISSDVVEGLSVAIDAFEADRTAKALVICCSGGTFVAGGDIASFDQPGFSAKPFNQVLDRIESQDRPVVAAMHGTVLGGGLELALASHWRLAQPGTQFGLPEVKLGLLPGSLGTQRLPRLVGISEALDLIATGRSINTEAARQIGIVDEVMEGVPQRAGAEFARALLPRGDRVRRLRECAVDTSELPVDFFEQALSKAQQSFYPAASAIVRAVEASLLSFSEGEAVEARLFEELRMSTESRALRHLFFAQREAGKIPGLSREVSVRPVRSVAVLGGGTMGRGIAMNFLNVGIPVVIVETTQLQLSAALAAIRELYEATAAKGKIRAEEVAARVSLLSGSIDDGALAECDLIIEAVFENMELKKEVMARLGRVCKSGAIIASNTSTLDIDVLASATSRPADVVGMHFFSPAHVMRLLEVVRGAQTSQDVLATAIQLARTIGKVAVVSGVCYGFIGNRMAEPYMREAEALILEGAQPADVDRAVEAIGMAMGPCRMLDMAGVDVGAKTVIEYRKAGGLPPDDSYRVLSRQLFELGRFGQKTGAGYYRYEGRSPVADPEIQEIANELAERHGIRRRASISQEEIFERLFYPMVNEAARILEEGIAYRASDIDVIWTSGYGFPDHRGGPMFLADEIGLTQIVERLDHYGRKHGNLFGYWTTSPLLTQLARCGKRLSDWKLAA